MPTEDTGRESGLAKQLDLFDWRPPCAVVAFPHGRLIGRARRLVVLRQSTPREKMDAIWDRQIDELEATMILAGLSPEEQERQLLAFADLVRAEITRADYSGGHHWPSGGVDLNVS